jgi:hypothetical protein
MLHQLLLLRKRLLFLSLLNLQLKKHLLLQLPSRM